MIYESSVRDNLTFGAIQDLFEDFGFDSQNVLMVNRTGTGAEVFVNSGAETSTANAFWQLGFEVENVESAGGPEEMALVRIAALSNDKRLTRYDSIVGG